MKYKCKYYTAWIKLDPLRVLRYSFTSSRLNSKIKIVRELSEYRRSMYHHIRRK